MSKLQFLMSKQLRMSKVISTVALVISALAGCGGGASTSLPSVASMSQLATAAGTARGPEAAPLGIAIQASSGNAYATAVLADSPLAYYQLNDSSSSLVDSGAHRLAGKYGSSITHHVESITQGSSGATGFPGGSSYNPNGLAYTGPTIVLQPSRVTLEVWFKKNASAALNTHVPIAVYGDAKGVSYGLYLEGLGSNIDRIYYQQRNTGQGTLFFHGMTHFSVGVLYHVVATFDGMHVTTYVNGLLDQTATYPGVISYATHLSQGTQIGGEKLDPTYTGFPSFPGTIAQVAIYGSALPQQTVVGHFLAGQLLPMIAEAATPADFFVDSIGINTHFNSNHSLYITQFSKVQSLLVASGIRHFRDNISFGSDYISKMKQLAASNIHGTYITSPVMTQAQIQSYPSLVSPSLEQFEAPNEQDDQSNPNWPPGCVAFQKKLYSWVKGYPAIAHYPVLGPGLAFAVNYKQIGNLSSYLDTGNVHDYMGAYNPGFAGGPWNGMKAMLSDEQVTSGTKPVMSTETGYGTVGSYPSLDDRTHLRYMDRMFFEQFNAGMERSYSYEFIDESSSGGFASFGLLKNDLTPKPAYTGIKSLIGALRDPGSPFIPSSLTYNLSGLSTIRHLLMQKRDGTFILAVWLEVPSWNAVSGGDVVVPDQTVTLATANYFSTGTLSVMDESGTFSTSALPWKNQRATISVSDKVTLVAFGARP